MSELSIRHEAHESKGQFVVERDGEKLGELALRRLDASTWDIIHTRVDDALRGQGVARRLLDAAVGWARQNQLKFVLTCPYAKGQFEKDRGLDDVRAERR